VERVAKQNKAMHLRDLDEQADHSSEKTEERNGQNRHQELIIECQSRGMIARATLQLSARASDSGRRPGYNLDTDSSGDGLPISYVHTLIQSA
jgi:hypothetical protein